MAFLKILDTQQIRQADAYTITHEPIASADLMERAAGRLYDRLRLRLKKEQRIIIFSGTGNNGGDGLVIGRLLMRDGYHTDIFVLGHEKQGTAEFLLNLERLHHMGAKVNYLGRESDFPEIKANVLVVDALFGSGLNRPLEGLAARLVMHINQSGAIIVSVDIPSGLFADQPMPKGEGAIIRADHTFTFELPKLAFLLPENEYYVGNWEVVPIGLHPDFIQQAESDFFMPLPDFYKTILFSRSKFAHKGQFGHALLIAGSNDKGGAALLAAEACLRSGVGLLHVHLTLSLQTALLSRLPEAMLSIETHDVFTRLPDLSPYNAIGVGPGLGTAEPTKIALKLLIQQARVPVVFDADALNILAEHPSWLAFLPKGSILTPHPGEFRRLTGNWENSFERIEKQRQFSLKFGTIVVLKGAYTCISLPDGRCFFNNSGNPGMATAGSGDVLTGMITGLLARGYKSEHAALLGVYLHGLAGDLAARDVGQESLIASDITTRIGKAIMMLAEASVNPL